MEKAGEVKKIVIVGNKIVSIIFWQKIFKT